MAAIVAILGSKRAFNRTLSLACLLTAQLAALFVLASCGDEEMVMNAARTLLPVL